MSKSMAEGAAAHQPLIPPISLPPLEPLPASKQPKTIPALLALLRDVYSPSSPYLVAPPAESSDSYSLHPDLSRVVVRSVLEAFLDLKESWVYNIELAKTSGSVQLQNEGDTIGRRLPSSEPKSSEPGSSMSEGAVQQRRADHESGTPAGPIGSGSRPQQQHILSDDIILDYIPSLTSNNEGHKRLEGNTQTEEQKAVLEWLVNAQDAKTWRRELGLPAMYLLTHRLVSPETSHLDARSKGMSQALLNLAGKIAQDTDPLELRSAGDRVALFARAIFTLSRSSGLLDIGIQILRTLLMQYAPPGCLTPICATLLEACLLDGNADLALDVALLEINNVSFFPLHFTDVLSYFYLSGMAFAQSGRWKDAVDAFEIVVTIPSTAVSVMQSSAYNKLILTNLIQYGKSPRLPRYFSSSVQRSVRISSKAYVSLASAFESLREDKIAEALKEEEMASFRKNGDHELIQALLRTFPERRLLQLPKVYDRIFISRAAEAASSNVSGLIDEERCKTLIRDLIGRGDLFALIDEAEPASLTFTEGDEGYKSVEMVEHLTALTRQTAAQEAFLALQDKTLGLDKKWLRQVLANENIASTQAGSGGPSAPSGMQEGGAGVRGVGSNWADSGF